MSSNKNISFIVFLTITLDMIGVGIFIPVLPLLIAPNTAFNILPNSWNLANGEIMLGWLIAIYPLAQFIFNPILGQLSDYFGRKKILMIALIGSSIASLIYVVALSLHSILWLFIARLFDGITGSTVSPAQAIIADTSKTKDRAKNFALIGMAFGIGFIVGPAIGGILTDINISKYFNITTPFYFMSVLHIINALIVIFLLKETLAPSLRIKKYIFSPFKGFYNIYNAFKIPNLRGIISVAFLNNAGFTCFTTFFALILIKVFNFSQIHIGNYFAFMGIAIIFMQGLVVRRMSGKVLEYQVLRYSIFGSSICIMIYFLNAMFFHEIHILYYLIPFLALANACNNSFSATLVTRMTPSNLRGTNFGVYSSMLALAQSIPAILSGYIASIDTSYSILLGAILILLAGLCVWLLIKPYSLEFNN